MASISSPATGHCDFINDACAIVNRQVKGIRTFRVGGNCELKRHALAFVVGNRVNQRLSGGYRRPVVNDDERIVNGVGMCNIGKGVSIVFDGE